MSQLEFSHGTLILLNSRFSKCVGETQKFAEDYLHFQLIYVLFYDGLIRKLADSIKKQTRESGL
jgi:hypothetical protein